MDNVLLSLQRQGLVGCQLPASPTHQSFSWDICLFELVSVNPVCCRCIPQLHRDNSADTDALNQEIHTGEKIYLQPQVLPAKGLRRVATAPIWSCGHGTGAAVSLLVATQHRRAGTNGHQACWCGSSGLAVGHYVFKTCHKSSDSINLMTLT